MRFILLLALLVPFVALAESPVPRDDTQLGMNEAAGQRLRAAESEMKTALEALARAASGQVAAAPKLLKAQAAWEAYRDAQLEALWPSPDIPAYGSAHPMCVAMLKTQLTEARVQELHAMLAPQEGDVCGSRWPD